MARAGNVVGAFTPVARIGLGGLDMCLDANSGTVYYIQSARPYSDSWTNEAKGKDLHLKSVNALAADPNSTITDWGRLIDPNGRTPFRCEGMSTDGRNVYLTGDWRVALSEVGTNVSTYRYLDPGYEDLWRGQFFAVVNVSGQEDNLAPVASAGSDQSIELPAAAFLAGTVSDDGQPAPPAACTAAWSKLSGPGTVTLRQRRRGGHHGHVLHGRHVRAAADGQRLGPVRHG